MLAETACILAGSTPMASSERGPGPARQSPSSDRLSTAPDSGSLVHVRAEWISFYDDHYHRVVRFIMHAGASPADAQDAAQEAFTESWKLMTSNPAAWQAVDRKAGWVRTTALRRLTRPPGSRLVSLGWISGRVGGGIAAGASRPDRYSP